jgi:hypothetical protein
MTEEQLSEAMKRVAVLEAEAWKRAQMVDAKQKGFGRGRKRKHSFMVTDFLDCAERGMTVTQTSRHLGLPETRVQYMKKAYSIPFPDGRGKHPRRDSAG